MAIQIRRGTDAEWESNNSNIVAGEPAVTLDTGRFFVGTGNGEFVELQKKGDGDLLTEDVKQALLQIASKVAYIDADGQDYYDALESALYPDASLQYITAVYTQGGTVYDTDSLDSLKADLVVTAHFDDSSTEVVTAYTLSGTLEVGTSTITVSYGGKTTTFNVTVTAILYPLRDGTYETANGQYRFTITNGNHIKAEVIRAGSTVTTNFTMLNCYTGNYSISNSDAVNNLPAYFNLPANTLATLKVKNIVNSANGGTIYPEFIVLLRGANSTTSVLATTQSAHTTDQTVTVTPSGSTDVGAIGFGLNGFKYKQGAYVEFDVELTVGDDIYVGGAS